MPRTLLIQIRPFPAMPFGRKAPAPNGLKLFNIDLHHAVISDVKDVMARIYGDKVAVVDWRINKMDGTCFGFAPTAKNVGDVAHADECIGGRMLLNYLTFYGINTRLIEQWVARYRLELSAYDGFIVTHSPVFCRLFESFGKPIIMVNSCRYDIPYCFTGNLKERHELHACLRRLQAKGLLVAVSNNKADQAYMKLGSGIDSVHIPSLCAYTNVSYNPEFAQHQNPLIMSEQTKIVPPHVETLLKDAGIWRVGVCDKSTEPKMPEQHPQSLQPPSPAQKKKWRLATESVQATPWPVIHQRKALVHFPYEVSTMSVFEQYCAGVPLLFPSRRFLTELAHKYAEEDKLLNRFTSSRARLSAHKYWTQHHNYVVNKQFADEFGRLSEMVADGEAVVTPIQSQRHDSPEHDEVEICFGKVDRVIPDELRGTMDIDWWTEKADFYDAEWMPFVKYFDSWEELVELVQSALDPEAHRQKVAWLGERRGKILSMWRQLMKQTFPQTDALAAEQEKRVEEKRKQQEKQQEEQRRRNINEKQLVWEETLAKVPTPHGDKTLWGVQEGRGNEEAQRLSLVIIEPREHPWMRAALHNACNVYGGSGAHLYIFHSQQNKAFIEEIIAGWSGVNLVALPKGGKGGAPDAEDFSLVDYQVFVTSSWFYQHFPTSHCLIFQTDVLMRRRIPASLFRFHYVGAPWNHMPVCSFTDNGKPVIWHGHNGRKLVGNGGFSLRDVAAMQKICSSFSFGDLVDHCQKIFQDGRARLADFRPGKLRLDPRDAMVNEDVWFCSHVAPDKLPLNHEAAEFGVEIIWHPNPCGLHKAYVSWEVGPRMYTTDMLAALLETVVDPTRAPDTHKFGDRKSCIDRLHPEHICDEISVQEAPADFGAYEVVWGPISKVRSSGGEDYFLHPCDRALPEGACRPAEAFEECREQPATL